MTAMVFAICSGRPAPRRIPPFCLAALLSVSLAIVLFAATPRLSPAATVLFCRFDSLDGWSLRTVGAATAELVTGDDDARGVQVTSEHGTVLLSRDLPLDQVAGTRLTIRCLAESRDIVRGPQASSTGRIHLAVQTPRGTQHFRVQLVGTSEPSWEGITADVPADTKRAVLNLGLETCRGQARFGQLTVKNDRRGIHPLDLGQVFNAEHEQLGLTAFPAGTIQWNDVPLRVAAAADNNGLDCLRLRGLEHPDWPPRTTAPIPVGTGATAIYILHAALDGQPRRESPAAIWTAHFVGGHSTNLSLFEGRQLGAAGQSEDLDEWKVAWPVPAAATPGEFPAGEPTAGESATDGSEQAESTPDQASAGVTFGVTKWVIYNDAPIESLSCRAYRGASPVTLAVTVVEEPPSAQPPAGDFNEMGDAWEMGE